MQHLRGFEIDVFPVTNTKGRRVKIFDTRHEVKVVIPWDYQFNNSKEIAFNYLRNRGINCVAFTYNEKNYLYTILTDDFATPLKEVVSLSYGCEEMLWVVEMVNGLQVDQIRSLMQGCTDPDYYNPNALRQIISAFNELDDNPFDVHFIAEKAQEMLDIMEAIE